MDQTRLRGPQMGITKTLGHHLVTGTQDLLRKYWEETESSGKETVVEGILYSHGKIKNTLK